MASQGPLVGVRVVDLTAMVMGPYCTQIMADMGADVIKVEPPEGDNTRYISVGPAPGMSGVFVNVNRGKRSVVLDLRTEAGKAALQALIKTADVFIHSMRSKAIAKLGFGYDDVAAINPAIVYTNCYGYGRRGPNRDLPAYDDTIQAECGLPAVQEQLTGEAELRRHHHGRQGRRPDRALRHDDGAVPPRANRRGPRGRSQHVRDDGVVHARRTRQRRDVRSAPRTGGVSAHGGAEPAAVPHQRRPHRGADLQRQALERLHQRRAAGLGDGVVRHSRTARERTSTPSTDCWPKRCRSAPPTEWLALFRELEIPAAPLNTPDALFDHPHLNAVGLFETVDTQYGPVRLPGVPTWFSRTPGGSPGPPASWARIPPSA